MKLKNKKIWCTVMIVIIVAIDQITKYFAKAYLYGKGAKPFIKGVSSDSLSVVFKKKSAVWV